MPKTTHAPNGPVRKLDGKEVKLAYHAIGPLVCLLTVIAGLVTNLDASTNDPAPEKRRLETLPFRPATLALVRQKLNQQTDLLKTAELITLTDTARPPQPLRNIYYEGLLPDHPQRRTTTQALQDMRHLAECLWLWTATAEDRWANRGVEVASAWASTYQPVGNPINENKLEPVLTAGLLLREYFQNEQYETLRTWAYHLYTQLSATPIEADNWGSKRLKIILLSKMLAYPEETHLESVCVLLKGFVDRTLLADGTTRDFHHRDSLSYHNSCLLPLLHCLVILHESDPSALALWNYVGAEGGSLARSTAFIYPFARGEKTHRQWQNSKVPLDHARAAVGLAKYQPGSLFPSDEAIPLLRWAVCFDSLAKKVLIDLSPTGSDDPYDQILSIALATIFTE